VRSWLRSCEPSAEFENDSHSSGCDLARAIPGKIGSCCPNPECCHPKFSLRSRLVIQFLRCKSRVIKEGFDSVFRDYGFELQGDLVLSGGGENIITASKGGIDLLFYLGASPLFYYCNISIKLSGDIAEKATSNLGYRHLSVSSVARCLDPNYKRPSKGAQTKEEVIGLFEIEKEDLLKYCKDILLGDVSFWSSIVACMIEENEKAKNKVQKII
jgi:hypothetical protein